MSDIAFITLGCAKNEVDTDTMKAKLARGGYTLGNDPLKARLVIVNTCSFLLSATEEALDTIFDVLEAQKNANQGAKLLVAGCLPSRYGSSLEIELEQAAACISVAEEEDILKKVEEIIGPASSNSQNLPQAKRYEHQASAYVKISDGCDRFCSFCMIPYIRGRYHSFTQCSIENEVAELVKKGSKEIVFIGQDTGVWGCDLPGKQNICSLLEACAKKFPEIWFRLLYTQPETVDDKLLELMRDYENICSYLDIPLQHADKKLLCAMNRKGSFASYLNLIDRARTLVPDIMLRSTFMTGFPQESDEQFHTLLNFIDEANFDYAVVFAYSPEEGSQAARLPGQIDADTRQLRKEILTDACEAIGYRRMARMKGKTVLALCEGYEEDDTGLYALCRFQGQAPEVDGQIHVPISQMSEFMYASFARVCIKDSFCYELKGDIV